jgi:hypothetical protein
MVDMVENTKPTISVVVKGRFTEKNFNNAKITISKANDVSINIKDSTFR